MLLLIALPVILAIGFRLWICNLVFLWPALVIPAAVWQPRLFARATQLRAEADRLEAEHAARYGALPASEGT